MGMCSFAFAFQGQNIMLEMQAEMKKPSDFPKAVTVSTTLLFLIYLASTTVARATCGANTPEQLLQVLPDGPWKVIVGVLMIVHLVITYTILQQVLNRALCLAVMPSALDYGCVAHLHWFSVTTFVMVFAWFLANTIPLFEDIVNIQGAALSTWSGLTIPAILMIAIVYQQPDLKSRALLIASLAVLVISIYLCIVGTFSSLSLAISHATGG